MNGHWQEKDAPQRRKIMTGTPSRNALLARSVGVLLAVGFFLGFYGCKSRAQQAPPSAADPALTSSPFAGAAQ
jgi:hypothetical protein